MLNLEEYKLYLIDNETADNTIKNYMNTLEQLEKYLTIHNIKTLDKSVMRQYKAYLRSKEYKPNKKYEVSTLNQKITAINIYFNWFYKEYEIDDMNLNIKTFTIQNAAHRESIDENEFKALLKHSSEELRLFILTIGNVGLRIAEVCSIKKKDLYQSSIEIDNKGTVRVVAVPEFLKKQLKSFVKDKNDDELIFSKSQGSYRYQLKKAAGQAKIKKSKVYPHSIRHFFAKAFIKSGGDSTSLQQMLGHKNISTTTIYTKMNNEELSKTFRTISNGR